ncbi:MAG TPA: aminotransferase class I/II-fold pyridoxal phosphate-dependent enzyme [Actinomycetota bacterium]|nr:aminotransferase class I/II-fold pyridoxal phosphate-dependent enzyme [Actinomycetota bacterium]
MPGSASLSDEHGIGTRAVHPRTPPPQGGEPVAPVLDQSATYSFTDSEEFARASADKVGSGYVYTRWGNPTTDLFAGAVADLEGLEEGEAFSSGMAAISAAFMALCSPGDRVVSARQLYGGTHSLTSTVLPRFGISTELCDVDDFDAIKSALPGAKLFYCESIGNPAIKVADLARLSEITDDAGIPMVVDNTFASPILCRPAEYGASIVVHSATKFIGGHHDLIGGVLCTDLATMERVRTWTRELGPTLAPFNAWLALRGLATMHLRVERSSETALEVARALEEHPEIETVFYPALDSSPDKELTDRILSGRGGGTLAFEVRGGKDRASRFQDRLRLIKAAASLGGTHSLLVHAASVTHTQLDDAALFAAGISPGFCRLSVGLEDAADLIDDLTQALGN